MINTQNPQFAERVRTYLQRQHFMHHIGFELDVIAEGRTEGWLAIEQQHQQQKGFVHGGVVATLADIVAGFAAYTVVPATHHVVTADLRTAYLNPGTGQRLHAKGWVVKQGRRMCFCEAEVWDVHADKRIMISKAAATMAVVTPDDVPPPHTQQP